MNEWISVEQRVPDVGEIVLVYGKSGYDVAHYAKHSRTGDMHYWDSHVSVIMNVTHWMRLPEAPK